MPNISSSLLTTIQQKTGLSEKTILILNDLSPMVLKYMLTQLRSCASVIKAQIDHYHFQSGWSNTAKLKLRNNIDLIDGVLEEANRVFQVVPWQVITKNNSDFAWLVDLLRKNMDKVGNISLGSFNTPDFQGVSSIEDLRKKKEEFSFRLQQMINVEYYAESGKAALQEQIRKLQQWIEAILYLTLGAGEVVYEFTGTIYATQSTAISWAGGTLSIAGNTYTIIGGAYSGLTKGDWYLYFDSDGATNTFSVTDGYETAGSRPNIRIAKLTATSNTIIEIFPYGLISYY